jgi:TNF receptor-associated factor 2
VAILQRLAGGLGAYSKWQSLLSCKREVVSALQVQQLERSIGLKDLAMADLEQKVLELEASTYDGVFIWKISDFARKRQEAVAGRTPAIFSPGAHPGLPTCLTVFLYTLCPLPPVATWNSSPDRAGHIFS